MSPEDLAANREMVRDLNELIRERIGGGDPDATEFLAKHGQFFPGRADLRRHHRPARAADGRHAVADALDEPGAARRAPVDDGGPPARRPAPGRPRPARIQPRPPAARRARRPGPVRRRRATRRSRAHWPRSPGSRRWTGWRTRCPTSSHRPTSPPSIATRCATCSVTTRRASSMRSTTSRAGSRRPAT